MKKYFSLLLSVVFFSTAAFSQSMEETMAKLAGDAGKGFVQPVVSAFGANLNGGWFHKSPKSKLFGIDLEVGLVAMGTFTTDENKTFSATGAFKFSGGPVVGSSSTTKSEAQKIAENMTVNNVSFYSLPTNEQQAIVNAIANMTFNVGINGPTIVGTKTDNMKITLANTAFSYTSPNTNQTVSTTIPGKTTTLDGVTGVLDGSAIIPLAAPQATIGTILGTQATFRYLPEVEISPDLGKFKYFGFGVQHNLGFWLPIPIVDVAASFFTQKLNVGTLMEAKTTAFGLNVSKQFGFAFLNVTPYGGFMLESSKMNFGYDFVPNSANPNNVERISFELEGENKSRITVGLSLRILVININADYNIGKQNSATAGVFFAF